MCVKKQWKDVFFNLLFRDFLEQLGWAKRNWKPDGGFNAELKLDHGSGHGHYQPSFHVKYTQISQLISLSSNISQYPNVFNSQ